MAHYAFLDENNIVVDVMVGKDENDLDNLPEGFSSWEEWYGNFKGLTCIRTSYNTVQNQHLLDGIPFRGNYASIGYKYDVDNDVFYSQKPINFDSWILDETTWMWKPPVDVPDDGNQYNWDEATLSWVLIN